jgi:hypothetical protein
MAKTQIPDHIESRFREVEKERAALEGELEGHQKKLRKLGDTPQARAAHPEGGENLARVNDVKARISTISFEHAELARARALILGGKNYMPPPG